jgi:hypothetical protein
LRLRLAQGRHLRGAQRRFARQKASLREARKSDEMPRWGWSNHADLLKKWTLRQAYYKKTSQNKIVYYYLYIIHTLLMIQW